MSTGKESVLSDDCEVVSDAIKNNQKVIIFSTPTCPACVALKKCIDEKALNSELIQQIDVTTDEGAKLANELDIKFLPFVALIEKEEEG